MALAAGAGSAGCSPARPPLLWRLSGVPLCLPLKVGTGDDPGQDAQPRLHRLLLCVRVLRGCFPSALGLPAGGPGFRIARFPAAPGGTLRLVSSDVVSHILSLWVCGGVSVSRLGSSSRIMSFTSYMFGSPAASPTPQQSLNQPNPQRNHPWGRSYEGAYGPLC